MVAPGYNALGIHELMTVDGLADFVLDMPDEITQGLSVEQLLAMYDYHMKGSN